VCDSVCDCVWCVHVWRKFFKVKQLFNNIYMAHVYIITMIRAHTQYMMVCCFNISSSHVGSSNDNILLTISPGIEYLLCVSMITSHNHMLVILMINMVVN